MIDISMLAPSAGLPATPTAAAPAGQGQATSGAAGFLRLFEIVIGGMPKPGSTDTALEPGLGDAIPGTTDPISLLAGNASATDPAALLQALPQAEGLDSASSAQIASLLQSLGFDVGKDQIAALGPLDRMQLDQAMEFIQRGLESGMPTGEILENAAFLMPREWDYEGSASAVAPRTEHLASGDPESDSADPAAILAASEAIRQVLASVPGAPANRPESASEQEVALVATSRDPRRQDASIDAASLATRTSAPDRPEVVAAPVAEHVRARAGIADKAPAAPSTSAEEADVPADQPLDTAAARPQFPHATASRRHPSDALAATVPNPSSPNESVATPKSGIRSTISSTAGAESSVAGPSATVASSSSRLESAPALPVAANIVPTPTEGRALQVQGVKPGSMASEFIGRQVLEKVDVHLKQGKRELSVRLWPEELGEVRLSLRIGEADKLDARILVQTESVRQAILDATPQLREALSRNGMEMGRLSVNVEQSRGGFQQAGGERREPSRQGSRQRTAREGWSDEEFDYAAPLALGIDSGIRDGRNTLDMWS